MRTVRKVRNPPRRRTVVAGTRRRPEPRPERDAELRVEPPDEIADETPDEPVTRRFPYVLLAIAVALASVGLWLRADRPNDDLTAVSAQVRDSLEQVFSYRYDDTVTTERAARETLTGEAQGQYAKLFEQIKAHAAEQRITVTAKVVSVGVVSLEDEQARLLAFLDQSATRGDTHTTSAGAAQLSVSARRIDGRWRISELVPR
ncbi:hypothetical protein [Kibdelosporangium phytohabitans]|uniref:Mce-associated membrane protein n=1 Tax=Kibdelosporangium phytohabitans TaxID=860235 RepID=A0A0N9IBK4_9PSEU|nr:hypothetical protein [Kibdelosporangium phytohabitans]ALG11876.1 hypothetical protein AOZ06_37875 [Kibdelosporangium phytohabitans]MBE1463312.1 Mce-associated membrane protein [Kibdelosporangium phytohabitans]